MATTYKIALKFNLANITVGMNVFYMSVQDSFPGGDSALLALAEDWMDAVWSPMRNFIDSGVTLLTAHLYELNDATGEVVRIVGTFAPVVNGNIAGNALPFVDAGSIFARTAIPRVRGTKSIAGFGQAASLEGLFTNAALAGLAAATAAWLAGPPSLLAEGGVWSSKVLGFVPFVNGGGATNVPGTRVSRRPGRGL